MKIKLFNDKEFQKYKIELVEDITLWYKDQFNRDNKVTFKTCVLITQRDDIKNLKEIEYHRPFFLASFLPNDIPIFTEEPESIEVDLNENKKK